MNTHDLKWHLKSWGWIICVILLSIFSFNTQSFWIDECCSANGAAYSDFGGLWEYTWAHGSDPLSFGYHLILWIWVSLIHPETELMHRLLNVVFVVPACYAFRKNPSALLLLCVSPFFLYYVNELRPYCMMMAASCFMAVYYFKALKGKEVSSHAFWGAGLFLCLSGLMGAVWFSFFVLAYGMMKYRDKGWKEWMVSFLGWMPIFIGLACFYAYAMLYGKGPAAFNSNGFFQAASALFELVGATGFSAGRLIIRSEPSQFIVGWYLWGPFLALMAVAFVAGIRKFYRQYGPFALMSFGLIFAPVILFTLYSHFSSFRFSGRHCSPLLPFMCMIIAPLFSEQSFRSRIIFYGVVVGWITASFFMRYGTACQREDNRAAVQLAELFKASGKKVVLGVNEQVMKQYHYAPQRVDANEADVHILGLRLFPNPYPYLNSLGSERELRQQKCALFGFRIFVRHPL